MKQLRRFFKITLGTLLGLTVLLIAAIIITLLVFDPNKYKSDIAAVVQKATGRDLQIQGNLKLSFFPWLGLETGAMRLGNAPGFGEEAFAKVEGAAVKVKLLPFLLRKDLEVDTITLNGLYLHLERAASGLANWDNLMAKENQPSTTPVIPGSSKTTSTLAIGGVNIQDATVIWDDRQKNTHYELDKLALRTGSILPNLPVKLDMDTEFVSSKPALSGHLRLTTQALYDVAAQSLQCNGLALAVDAHGQSLPVDDVTLNLSGNATLKLADKDYRLKDFRSQVSLRGDTLPGKQLDATINGNVIVDLQKEMLAIEPLSLTAWNLKLNGNVQSQHILDAPRFTGELSVTSFDARDLLDRLGGTLPATADKRALSSVAAIVEFNASATDAEFTKLQVTVDQTHITGKVSIKNFAHPAYRFQLALDNIDADRYLPPPTPGKTQATVPVTAAAVGAGAAEKPLATLRALDGEGDIGIRKFKIAKLAMRDIKLGLAAKTGILRITPLTAHLYGGEHHGDLQLDARGKTAQVTINESMNGIAIGPLARDLLGEDLITGTGFVHFKLHGVGLNPKALKPTLNGTFDFSLQNGQLNSVNLIDLIQKNYLKYLQGMAINTGKLDKTEFSKFAATATVSNGLIATQDLMLNSARLNVKGRGTVNLVDEVLALRLEAEPTGQLAKQLGPYKDTVIPIQVDGILSAPKFAIDLDGLLKQKAKSRFDKEKQKLQQQLKNKFKNLFN